MNSGLGEAGAPLVATEVRPDEDALPASHAQERMWFFERLNGATPAYNMPAALEMRGVLDPLALRGALADTIARHESLRTRFLEIDGQLMQIVSQAKPCLELPLIDLVDADCPSGSASATLNARIATDANAPFDLTTAAPIRFILFRFHERRHVLYACMHHIVSDGWSIGILIREVTVRYLERVSGEPACLDELPIQYADYASWQREQVARTPETGNDPAYWRERLAGLPPEIDLPIDAPRPRKLSGRGGWHVAMLDGALGERLKSVSRAHGVTPFMMMLAVFGLFLMRIGCRRDLAIGTTIAGRTQPQTQPLIGLFVNTIVLRLLVDGDPPFGAWLQQVKDVCIRGYAHQEWPFDRVVAALRPERGLGFLPIFQVMFSMQGVPHTEIAMPGLTIARMPVTTDTSKFDLALDAEEVDDGLILNWEYSTDLFDGKTIEHWAASFTCLLEAVLDDAQQRLSALPLLPGAERADASVEAGADDDDSDDPSRVPVGDGVEAFDDRFRHICRATPEAIAAEDNVRAISYRTLDAWSGRIAQTLQAGGARAGEPVGFCLGRGVRVLAALLGILKAGGTCVPLTPDRVAERVGELAEADRPRWLLVDGQTESRSSLLGARMLRVDDDGHEVCQAEADGACDAIDQAFTEANAASARRFQRACLARSAAIHDGRAPHVAITHRNLCAASSAWQAALASNAKSARWTQIVDIDSGAFVADLLRTIGTGGTMVMCGSVVDAKSLTEWLVSRKINAAALTPAVLRELAWHWERAGVPSGLPLTFVVDAAEENWHNADQSRVRALLGPAVRVIVAYGIAETTFTGGFYEPSDARVAGCVPIGRALQSGRLRVLDEARRPMPVGAVGELCIGGATVAAGNGHAHAPAVDTSIADAESARGSSLYRTGDLARMRADGAIELVCRKGDAIELRGWRIPRGFVEDALLRLSGVRHAKIVIGEASPGELALVAYVVSDADDWRPCVLRAALRLVLPEHMVPSVWVRLGGQPPILGGELKLGLRGTPVLAAADEAAAVAPHTRTERLLEWHWRELLGSVESLSALDDFFDVGGDSLLAVRLVSQLRHAYGIDLSVSALFETPTLRAFANRIDSMAPTLAT